VEPGEHTVIANVKGLPPAVQTVKVYPRQERLVVLRFETPKPVVVAPVPSGTQRAVALVLGGIGVAGLGVGTVFGLLAKSNNDEAAKHCLGSGACDPAGVSLGDAAETDATIATVTFLVGTATLATGVVLFLTAPSAGDAPDKTAATLRIGAASSGTATVLSLGGAW
jgi:serine/threonine-protein kinase